MTRVRPQANCHPEKKHYAKGLCSNCYNKLPRIREKRSLWQRNNRQKHLKYNQEYRKTHPEKYGRMTFKNNRGRNGWTLERFDEAIVSQNNSCAICGDSFDKVRVHADHEHSIPPRARQLLCSLCNKGLGQFLDSPERLDSAAAYLRRWGK